MSRDFTLKAYRQLLLALKNAGWKFYTFEQWCDLKPTASVVVLRHDVDLNANNSLHIAKIEAELGIQSSYYFRVVPSSNRPDVIRQIAALGHEIGYHYEDLAICKGNFDLALSHFLDKLLYFRIFYPVRTVCMHGSPTSKFDNRNMWNYTNYTNFDLVGEPYFDFLLDDEHLFYYFTDTARMWDGDKYNVRDKAQYSVSSNQNTIYKGVHSTTDLICWIENHEPDKNMMITTHPQRWTNNWVGWVTEYLMQNCKNIVKRILYVK